MDRINVEEIMNEIREDIRQKGYTSDMLSFKDIECPIAYDYQYDNKEFLSILAGINANNNVAWYRDLHQGGIKGRIKKVIRKLIAFIIAPMSDEQNLFNVQVTQGFNQLCGYIEAQTAEIELYKKKVMLLEQKMQELENEKKSGENM